MGGGKVDSSTNRLKVPVGTLELQNVSSNITCKSSKCLGVKEQVWVNRNDRFGF